MATSTDRGTPTTSTERDIPVPATRPAGATRWLRILTLWRVVHLVLAALGAFLLFTGDAPEGRLAEFLGLMAALVAVADIYALVSLRRGRHGGRAASLALDYLTFVGCVLVLLQVTDTFVGLDALGANFGRGAPFVVAALLILILSGTAAPRIARICRIAAAVLGVVALVVVGLLPGLWTFLGRVAQPVPLLVLLGAVSSGLVARRTYKPDIARLLGANRQNTRTLEGLLFASPNVLGFLAFFAGPLLFSLYVSLNDWDAFSAPSFVGLDNYIRILSLDVAIARDGVLSFADGYREIVRVGSLGLGARDPLFWTSITNILLFALLAIPASVLPALGLAQLLNIRAPGMRLFRAIFFVPLDRRRGGRRTHLEAAVQRHGRLAQLPHQSGGRPAER